MFYVIVIRWKREALLMERSLPLCLMTLFSNLQGYFVGPFSKITFIFYVDSPGKISL